MQTEGGGAVEGAALFYVHTVSGYRVARVTGFRLVAFAAGLQSGCVDGCPMFDQCSDLGASLLLLLDNNGGSWASVGGRAVCAAVGGYTCMSPLHLREFPCRLEQH